MSVYVDRARNPCGRMVMCHMLADSLEELHAMAERLGLRREWYQPKSSPHYDLSKAKRERALELGAVEIGREQVVALRRRWREVRLVVITPDNLAAACAVARRIFPREIHAGEFWPEKAYRMALACGSTDEFRYYLCESGGQSVGITGHYFEETPWLGWFGVLPEFRRCGLGGKILERTLAHLPVARELRLYCGTAPEDEPAHRFYAKHGFVEFDRGDVDGQEVVYYRKALC